MNIGHVIAAITPVVAVLEKLMVRYYLGGSVVSSTYGIPRATLDVDLVADLRSEHVQSFVQRLETEYYLDEEMIRDAIKHHASFNLIYLDTMLKIDIFLPKTRLFDQEEYRRVQHGALIAGTRSFSLASAEDTLLHKLEWYRMGNEISDRQWHDILGILKIRGVQLDMAYLRTWAIQLHVTDLLERALIDAGLMEAQ